MLDNLFFSLNIVTPLVILAFVGYALKRIGLISEAFSAGGNKMVFYLAIPASLFSSIYNANLSEIFDLRFMIFAAVWTILSMLVIWALTYMALKNKAKSVVSAFVNGAFRGNIAILALPVIDALLGDDGAKGAMALTVIIIIYNIQSIILLTLHSEKNNKLTAVSLVVAVAKNPPIVWVTIAIVFSLLNINLPAFASQTVSNLSSMVVPVALICLGANMTFKGFDAKFRYALYSSLVKVAVMPVAVSVVAYLAGFRGSDLAILMIMNAVPAAVAGYVMLVEIGGDVYVAATNVILTTVLSAFTLSLLIFAFLQIGII